MQLAQKLEHASLDRHVEGGGGLVGDDDLGVAADGHGDDDALAHAARELVGIGIHALLGVGDAHAAQGLDGHGAGGLLGDVLVGADHLHHLVAHLEDGVQGGHRVLEDHGDLVAAQGHELLLGELHHVDAVEVDLAAHDLAVLGEQPHDGGGGHALA